jgi:hypothetical protein
MGAQQSLEKQQKSQSSNSISASPLSSRGFSSQTVSDVKPLASIAAPNQTQHAIQNITFAVQPKLTIGQPNDAYEREADQVAEDVVQRIHSPQFAVSNPEDPNDLSIQRRSMPKINKLQMRAMQRQVAIDGREAGTELESSIAHARGGGQPLEEGLQRSMGRAMGADFSRVKIHTDMNADRLNRSIHARAFTTGKDIFFKSGQYNPGTIEGQKLIAHEATHTIQQGAVPSLQTQTENNSISSDGISVNRSPDVQNNQLDRVAVNLIKSDANYIQRGYEFTKDGELLYSYDKTIEDQIHHSRTIDGYATINTSAEYKHQFNYMGNVGGNLTLNSKGVSLTGKAEAGLNLASQGQVANQVKFKNTKVGAIAGYSAESALGARAGGEANISLKGISLRGKAEAFAGAKLDIQGSSDFVVNGKVLFKCTGGASASIGVGGNIEGTFKFHNGKLRIGGGVAATLGIGSGANFEVEVDYRNIATTIVELLTCELENKINPTPKIPSINSIENTKITNDSKIIALIHRHISKLFKEKSKHLIFSTCWSDIVEKSNKASSISECHKIQLDFINEVINNSNIGSLRDDMREKINLDGKEIIGYECRLFELNTDIFLDKQMITYRDLLVKGCCIEDPKQITGRMVESIFIDAIDKELGVTLLSIPRMNRGMSSYIRNGDIDRSDYFFNFTMFGKNYPKTPHLFTTILRAADSDTVRRRNQGWKSELPFDGCTTRS